MRRILGIATSGALALVLARGFAPAAGLIPAPAQYDFAAQLMLTLFGETSDATASFSAQNGDRFSESPLRELALRVPEPAVSGDRAGVPPADAQQLALASLSAFGAADLARAAEAGLLSTGLHFAAPAATLAPQAAALPAPGLSPTAAYQPVAPLPNISPEPGAVAFDNPASDDAPAQSVSAPPSLNFAAPQSHGLDFNVSGQYQQAGSSDSPGGGYALPATAWQPPNPDAAFTIPNPDGSNRLSLGAGLAVPVFHGLTLNLNYDAQRAYGGDLIAGANNLNATSNAYAGRLTYALPWRSSTLSVSAYQRFGQSVLPNDASTQIGEDVNFTVKF